MFYRATHVPVGDDQLQHLELARDIARSFNSTYGETFPEPKPLLGNVIVHTVLFRSVEIDSRQLEMSLCKLLYSLCSVHLPYPLDLSLINLPLILMNNVNASCLDRNSCTC